MIDKNKLELLEATIKKHAPAFKIVQKDDSRFMKFISKILFFSKGFMSRFVTTIGQTVYWRTSEKFGENPNSNFRTLAHEFVHVMDDKKNPVLFKLKYLHPQLLAAPGILFVLLSPVLIPLIALSILSPWWLLILTSLVFLAPIPSYGRTTTEIRGYGMSCKVAIWSGEEVPKSSIDHYVDNFTGSAYYFMWPSKTYVREKIEEYVYTDKCLKDENPAYREVYKILKT